MKYDYTEDIMKALLENISNLLILPQYRTRDENEAVAYLYKKLRSTTFEKPSESELWNYIKLVETLKPKDAEGKQAVKMAREDLYYLLYMRG